MKWVWKTDTLKVTIASDFKVLLLFITCIGSDELHRLCSRIVQSIESSSYRLWPIIFICCDSWCVYDQQKLSTIKRNSYQHTWHKTKSGFLPLTISVIYTERWHGFLGCWVSAPFRVFSAFYKIISESENLQVVFSVLWLC